LIKNNVRTNLETDLWIQQELNHLSQLYFASVVSKKRANTHSDAILA